MKTIDGNEAAASIAYRVSEFCAIYPITPASPMGELADEWASEGRRNIWGAVPHVVELQSEGGAAGAVHGALQTGCLSTTFTASQGLLLMIPNMFKIAGELLPTVFHVAARSLAAQALSIFGDHSDVMAARTTGWAMLCSGSVQEAHDLALVAHAATLETRVPFVHFFDGFRTSHQISKVTTIDDEIVRAMIDDEQVVAHRARALDPDRPVIRGVAQNPDVYFQGRETVNPFYAAIPETVKRAMDRFATLTGRQYRLFDYFGAPDAERVIVLMGSGAETARETVDYLNEHGSRVGVIQVHLFRPFSTVDLVDAIPESARAVAVLDRTKEPGASGEPLYLDVVTALSEAVTSDIRRRALPRVIGGRYGLGSKEFTPAMVKAVFDELSSETPRNHFTIGILDDLTHSSLAWDPAFVIEPDDVVGCTFYGLGSDGTVGANKNSIKIIGEETRGHAQGFFVYDSKKSGSRTVSHLRFGPRPIRSPYLVQRARFIACHQFQFLGRVEMLREAAEGAIFLLNSPHGPTRTWDELPRAVQDDIVRKRIRLFVIDADRVAADAGMAGRINTVMQTCFFAIAGVLPRDEAILQIKQSIEATYGRKGRELVEQNFAAVDQALAHLHEVSIPNMPTGTREVPPIVPAVAPAFVRHVTGPMMAGHGDELPVSALPADGTYPTGTAKWEKRNISSDVPVWRSEICIQCGNCTMVCPHSAIRARYYPDSYLADAPGGFASARLAGRGYPNHRFTLQVAVEDCTGCELCVMACPVRNGDSETRAIYMAAKAPILDRERRNLEFFDRLPDNRPEDVDISLVRGVQYLRPLFEFSGACAGCGETPYLRLLTQLFGDRLVVANATGCSSIYGGNLPTTPWTTNASGRGPAWANSLFEDNAEFGLGFRLSIDTQREMAVDLLRQFEPELGTARVREILEAPQRTSAEVEAQRARVRNLLITLGDELDPRARRLRSMARYLVRRSVWIVGGDGWAYDIGFGGLDHVLASGHDVNLLVLDTEVYSNTGGQASKSTPRGAVARFAAAGKPGRKKDLGVMAMAYGNVYVAQVAMGASAPQTLQALLEAEAHDGPSLVIAYGHCIAHGIDMRFGLQQQKLAVDCGHWPLYRFKPAASGQTRGEFCLDSQPPSIPFEAYAHNENRYRTLSLTRPENAARLLKLAQEDVNHRWQDYKSLAERFPAALSTTTN
jgi:pyruvate-ferredoxin/flavodoxin oxidoreductase